MLTDADRGFWDQVASRWCGGNHAVNNAALQAAAASDTARMEEELALHQTRTRIPTALAALLDSDDDDSDDDW